MIPRRRRSENFGEATRFRFAGAATHTASSLATFSACFCRPFTVVGEIAGTVLTTEVTGASGLFAILREVSRISGVL
jgi:hypothetical protein